MAWRENGLKGKQIYFELVGGLSYWRFGLSGVNWTNVQWNLALRPPRYYGHFILARTKAQSVIFLFKEPLNAATALLRPVFFGP